MKADNMIGKKVAKMVKMAAMNASNSVWKYYVDKEASDYDGILSKAIKLTQEYTAYH